MKPAYKSPYFAQLMVSVEKQRHIESLEAQLREAQTALKEIQSEIGAATDTMEQDADDAEFRRIRDEYLVSLTGIKAPSFSTWDSFGALFIWCQSQAWWGGFIHHHGKLLCDCGCNDGRLDISVIEPDLFASCVQHYVQRMERNRASTRSCTCHCTGKHTDSNETA